MANSDNHRLFIGIKIVPSGSILSYINQLQENLWDSKIKWVSRENYHITLKFLGDTPHYYINSIDLIIQNVLSGIKKIEVTLKGCGFFGKPNPQIIWLGLNHSKTLYDIQTRLNSELKELGFSSDSELFKPHLTIGRIKYLKSVDEFIQQIDKISSALTEEKHNIRSVELMESILKSDGPKYHQVRKYTF